MPAPAAILKLCETFAGHRDHFRSGNYNEAQLRKEFLDPLVEPMLEIVPKRRLEKNPQVLAQLDAQIAATDRQIDRLVYELYGLTEEEVKLVEGNAASITA
jgi:hypothetical protein